MNTARRPARILFRRKGALGDVLCTTPAIRAMRRREGAAAVIDVETDYPFLFNHNPDVNAAFGMRADGGASSTYDRIVDLNLAYERQPRIHVVDAYLLATFGPESTVAEADRHIAFYFDAKAHSRFFSATELARTVVVHAAVTWPNRTMRPEFWGALLSRLLSKGYRIIVVGGAQDLAPEPAANVANLVNKGLSLGDMASIIHQSACFVTMDSGLLHLAGATGAPIVAMFSCAKAQYRVPYRGGALGKDVVAVVPPIDCYGCLADVPPPATVCGCRRNDLACLKSFQPDLVAHCVERAAALATLRGPSPGAAVAPSR